MELQSELINLHAGWGGIKDKTKALLILIWLRHTGYITEAKLKGMYKSYRAGNYDKPLGTWNSGVYNPRDRTTLWYSESPAGYTKTKALIEMFNDDLRITTPLPYAVLLKYLKLYFNACTNYCIDWLWSEVVYPVLWDSTEHVDLLGLPIEVMTYEKADRMYDLADGYCCSDCDGCKGEYKRATYARYYARKEEEAITAAKAYMNSLKTHQKNPKNILLKPF